MNVNPQVKFILYNQALKLRGKMRERKIGYSKNFALTNNPLRDKILKVKIWKEAYKNDPSGS